MRRVRRRAARREGRRARLPGLGGRRHDPEDVLPVPFAAEHAADDAGADAAGSARRGSSAASEMGWWDRRDEREVDVVSGMFMLVRREALDEVGPMDDGYFMYAEEADWCWRFWKRGWTVRVHPARADHAPRRRRQEHAALGGREREDVRAAAEEHPAVPPQEPRAALVGAAQAIYAVVMPVRSAAFALMALVGRGDRRRLQAPRRRGRDPLPPAPNRAATVTLTAVRHHKATNMTRSPSQRYRHSRRDVHVVRRRARDRGRVGRLARLTGRCT